MRTAWTCFIGLLWAACAGSGLPSIIDARDVRPASGAPTITRVRDAGTAMVPRSGALEAITDGIASPGELLVVEGGGFGRQPTVTVGGRPTEVLARTRGDGLVVRVPGGAEVGRVELVVTTSGGSARHEVELRRFALVLAEGRLRFVLVGRDELRPLPHSLEIKDARAVRVDSTGGIALVLGDSSEGSRLSVVDLGRGEPSLLGGLDIPHRGAALATASVAPRVAVVGDGRLSMLDTTSLRRPVVYQSVALPKEVRGIRAAELSPDGRTLALLLGEGNRLIALDVSTPTAPQIISSVEILPNERLGLVRALGFSPDGQSLWVISGASP
jgi:hypothetical protein